MWFRVDDTLPTHHRVIDAGNAAMGLWVRAGAWSMGQLTDGYIPTGAAHMLGNDDQIAALLRTGLWHEVPGGYQFHMWAEDGSGAPRQPTRAEIEAKRKADRDRKRDAIAKLRGRGGRMESTQTPPIVPDGVATDSERNPHGIQTESQRPSDLPDPTRPDPKFPSSSNEEEGARKKRAPAATGDRIPDPFVVNTDMRQWAHDELPGLDIDASTRAFVDHWRSVPGAKGKKLDWLATWRNWLRKDWKDTQPRRGHLQAVRPDKDQRAAEVLRMGQELDAAQQQATNDGLDFLDLKAIPQ